MSEEQKADIWGMVASDFKLFAIKKLMGYGISLEEAKSVSLHINTKSEKCHRCDFDGLDTEYGPCPKCKAFNINWAIDKSFNQDFCHFLEYQIEPMLSNSEDDLVRGFWCDGIYSIPDNPRDLVLKNILKNKTIKTRAKLGKSGQESYAMIIHLGEEALYHYSRKESMIDSVPSTETMDWIKVDVDNKQVFLYLK